MTPRTIQLPRLAPDLDDTFIHVWGSALIDTGHPNHRDEVQQAVSNSDIQTVLLTSRDIHSTGNLDLFPDAKIYGFPADDSFVIGFPNEPGMEDLTSLLFVDSEPASIDTVTEGDVIELEHGSLDVIALPIPDRSAVMFHEPDQAMTFVGAIPSGRLPMWCASAEDYALGCQRLDAIDLGHVYSRVDPPTDNPEWFKKRAQRFVEHFSSTLSEKRSSADLLEFLERDFGGVPDDPAEWAAAILRYQAFF